MAIQNLYDDAQATKVLTLNLNGPIWGGFCQGTGPHLAYFADFNFALILRVTIGCYRRTSRISHDIDYRGYRMTIAHIACDTLTTLKRLSEPLKRSNLLFSTLEFYS